MILQGAHLIESQLQHWSSLKPDSISLQETTGQNMSYRQLEMAVQSLREYFGPLPQTILVALNGGIVDSALWLAALSGGHTLIPVSPHVTIYEYQASLQQHRPDLCIVEEIPKTKSNIPTITGSSVHAILLEERTARTVAVEEGSVVLATSGSTGKPKGILLSASQCTYTANAIIDSHKLTATDRCLTPLPFYHVNAPIVSLLSTILSGGQLTIAPRYSTEAFWTWVRDYQPTWINIVPTMLTMLLTAPMLPTKKSSVRFVRTASAPLPKATLEQFETTYNIPVIETYGISEAAATIAANPVPPAAHKPGSVGLPIGVEMRICQPGKLSAMKQGEIGEVCIRGQNVITEYQGGVDPDSFKNGWFRTGDLGKFDRDGYLFLTGRSKDIIVRGGENIQPREIEEVLASFEDVSEVVVVGQLDPLYGEKVVAFVVKQPQARPDFEYRLQAYMVAHLSRYKVPAETYVVESIPRTHTGKADKPFLRGYNPEAGKDLAPSEA